MKIVNFTPGLGNQIFEFIFSEYLRKKYPNHSIYGYYNPKFLNEKHNGLEVHKMFDIQIPPANCLSNAMAFFCRASSRFIPCVKATEMRYSESAIYFDGWWQDKKFFLDTVNEINFRIPKLDEINSKLVDLITSENSVSLHVRRGDYLEPRFVKQYGGICTLDYYKKAIEIVNSKISNPHFFVFSNDIQWCIDNLPLKEATFVSNNIGANSWLDMYLMSICKMNILANSSFSYWGAMLNKNRNIVIYPGKWYNDKTPDIFPNNWIAL